MKVDDIRSIAIVGAGLMGHAMAQEFALAGYEVHTYNRTENRRETPTDYQKYPGKSPNAHIAWNGIPRAGRAEAKWGQVYC